MSAMSSIMTMRVILLCWLIQTAISFRHANNIITGKTRAISPMNLCSQTEKFSSDITYKNIFSPKKPYSFLTNTAIGTADTISMALLNSTIHVSDTKSSDLSWLDSISPLSDMTLFSDDNSIAVSPGKTLSIPQEDTLRLLLAYLLTSGLSTVSHSVIESKKSSDKQSSTASAAFSKLFVTALAVYLRSYSTNQLGMASTLYFNQPLPLLLRLSGDDLMSLHRLQRLGALLGGAFVGQYLLQSFGSVQWKKFSYRQVIRSIVSTVGIRGLAHAAKALWKWRKPLWRISAMFMRRSSKRGASSLWFSYTATRQQRQRSPGKEYMQMRRRPKSVII